ncbi:MAG: hypothetical protein Q8M76_18500, partial [Spirochaetaceae bacterium]|nr:hypothetical protein [Spirochaetaceae bacterium]
GKAKLTVKLDVQSSLDLLDKLPAKYAAYRDALAEDLKGKYAEIGYEVSSNARNVPTGVAIADFDESGAIMSGAQTQAGVIEALVREKFSARPVGADPAALAALEVGAAVEAARSAKLKRLVFGAARIAGVRKDGTSYIADAQASVKAVDVDTGELVYSAEKAASGVGSDEQSARRAALRELGVSSLGKDLLASLP